MMEQVIIDKGKCTGCGVCVTICPYRAIVLVEDKAEYILEECFLCGQCQAVCPVEAVRLPQLALKLGLQTITESEGVVPPGTTNVTDLVALMRSRRSCRKYLDKAVPLAMLEDLVKIGTTAPSGTNSQSWNFITVPTIADLQVLGGLVADYYRKLNRLAENPFLRFIMKIIGRDSLGRYFRRYHNSVAEALREWDKQGTDRLFHGAVAAILVTGKKDASCPAEDALLATQNMLLAAHAMGLGSCLIGFVVEAIRRDSKLRRQLEIPGDEEIYSVIALGYPAVNYLRPANRKVVVPRILRLT
ncbi:MAG: 4Fe-4S dicluster domain-containing protein [Desulfobulbaceae bacterium]|nr:4Fe-4S dicluster domain-containing protein [Desulfobulbaceae bacterium]